MVEDYCVRLDAFEGPLDLLLHLIRRAEVDIHDIPVAQIAGQYVKHLEQVHTIDIDLAGEFLVMAATLMEIKSRMLSPRPEGEGDADAERTGRPGDGVDPRADLVRQLLEYKRHRDAADALEERRLTWARRFPAGHAGIDKEAMAEAAARLQGADAAGALGEDAGPAGLDMEDLSLGDLVEAFAQVIAAVNFDRLGDHQITFDDTPMELHQADILDRLTREGTGGEVALLRVFEGRSRSEMVGLFIATLELVKQRRLRVRQGGPGEPIVLCRMGDGEVDPAAAMDAGGSDQADSDGAPDKGENAGG
ncbi:MAG: segregation/condensation protein A [Phycisphaeraceae bacterium]|nr:segregation/condensation protein A [Phycisphaeraceae bacterium]